MRSEIVTMARLKALTWLPLLLLAFSPRPVYPHGQPVQLAFWGGFPRSVARCQRVIAAAAVRCTRETVAARIACYDPLLAGQPCDTTTLNAEIAAIRQRARDSIPPYCSDTQLQQLSYQDLFDVFNDVVRSCRRLDTAVTSAIYAPALAGRSVPGPVGEEQRECITATGRMAARLLAYATGERQRALDRIASARMDPAGKRALVEHSRHRIVRARERLENRVALQCPGLAFQATYGRDSTVLLDNVARQADCLAEYVYVQDAVVCPAPVCGNGVAEPEEQCDDGNDRNGDGCTSACRSET